MKLKFERRGIENQEFKDEKNEVFGEKLKTLQFFMISTLFSCAWLLLNH